MARILIVEDEPEIQQLVRAYVEREGHTVVVAGDVEQARLLARERAALVFIDVTLPGGVSGLELVRELRHSGPNRHTPIVVISGNPHAAAEVAHLNVEVLAKPFRLAQLGAFLQRVKRG